MRVSKQGTGRTSDGGPATAAFVHTNASVLLDLLRGVAALLVVGDHLRNMLFVDYPQLPSHQVLAAIPYLLTSAGHQAVVIFFVLSGYLISGSIYRSIDRRQWSWSAYLTHRLVRLWIVLLPGLLLCVLWDLVGIRLHHAPQLYAGVNYNHLTVAVLPQLTFPTFFGNLFFLGGIHVPTLGSDGALWSLSFEFWYYILFPLGLILLVRPAPWLRRLALLGVLLGAGWIAGWGVLAAFPIWLLGALLARTHLPVLSFGARWIVAAAYIPILLLLTKSTLVMGLWADYLLGLATALLLVGLLSARSRADENSTPVRWTRRLARCSFTLYVAHLPFALLLTSLVAGDHRWIPAGWHLLAGLGVLLATLLYSYGIAVLTEFRTDNVRRWIEHRIGIRSSAESVAREAALVR